MLRRVDETRNRVGSIEAPILWPLLIGVASLSVVWFGASVVPAFDVARQARSLVMGLAGFLLDYTFSIVNVAVGAFLALHPRYRREPAKLALAIGMIGTGLGYNVRAHAILKGLGLDSWHLVFHVVSSYCYVIGLLRFPDGKLFGHARAATWPTILIVPVAAILVEAFQLVPGMQSYGIVLFGVAILMTGIAGQHYRVRTYDNSSEAHHRAAALRLAFIFMFIACVLVALFYVAVNGFDAPESGTQRQLSELFFLLLSPLLAGVPIVILFDLIGDPLVVDHVILYRTLVTYITAAYVLISVVIDKTLGRVGGGGEDILPALVVTLLVVGTFEPVKEKLTEAIAERVLRREDPAYRRLVQFCERLSELGDEEVLKYIAEWSRTVTKATHARVEVQQADGEPLVAESPEPFPFDGFEPIELKFRGMTLVRLWLRPRSRKGLTARQQRFLLDLGAAAVLACRGALLSGQLKRRLARAKADVDADPQMAPRSDGGFLDLSGPAEGAASPRTDVASRGGDQPGV